MRRKSWILVGGCLPALLALLAWSPEAHAFFPLGVYASESAGFEETLRLVRWPLTAMDTNGDGDVSGADEGIPITFESGPDGWTQQEQVILKQAFDVWANVPSSYVSFRYTQTLPSGQGGVINGSTYGDTIIASPGAVDNLNLIAKDFSKSLIPSGGNLGITIISFAATDQTVTSGGTTVQISGPAIIDCDIVLNSVLLGTGNDLQLAPTGEVLKYPLLGAAVHEIGHFIGLGHAPHNNFEFLWAALPGESTIFNQRDSLGALTTVGVTPTMYPVFFINEIGDGIYGSGAVDLAPDDVAGITYLYPRGDLENFFSLGHEARTTARANFPSEPIVGGLVQAWCDVDNNANTPRVPLYSTITSLFEQYPERSGMFEMINMYKVIETANGMPFNTSYTFTLSEVGSDDYLSTHLPGASPASFDSIHLDGTPFGTYSAGFLQQVFLEGGTNVLGIDRPDSGTPLTFDAARRKVVSTNTSRTLSEILPGTRPMFGTSLAETLCPLNIATASLATHVGPDTLRQLRDTVLLKSAAGSAVADLYYRIAPSMAELIRENSLALGMARTALATAEWVLAWWQTLLAGLAGLLAVAFWRVRRLRRVTIAALLLTVLVWSSPATASYGQLSMQKMVNLSDEIVTGQVVAIETRKTEEGQIVTDISIKVNNTIKGKSNKSGQVHFTQIGGEMDGIITIVPELPQWTEGEEVVVMLNENPLFSYMPVAGKSGKYLVEVDEDTGEKYVKADPVEAQTEVLKDLKSDDGKIDLGDFESYLCELVDAEKTDAP